jgi:hypothetical protein
MNISPPEPTSRQMMTNLCDKVIEMGAICYLEYLESSGPASAINLADKIMDSMDGITTRLENASRKRQKFPFDLRSLAILILGSFALARSRSLDEDFADKLAPPMRF